VLASIAGRYDYVLGEAGTYAPPPAPQFLNTLTTLEAGKGYFLRATANIDLVLVGVNFPPIRRSTLPAAGTGWATSRPWGSHCRES